MEDIFDFFYSNTRKMPYSKIKRSEITRRYAKYKKISEKEADELVLQSGLVKNKFVIGGLIWKEDLDNEEEMEECKRRKERTEERKKIRNEKNEIKDEKYSKNYILSRINSEILKFEDKKKNIEKYIEEKSEELEEIIDEINECEITKNKIIDMLFFDEK